MKMTAKQQLWTACFNGKPKYISQSDEICPFSVVVTKQIVYNNIVRVFHFFFSMLYPLFCGCWLPSIDKKDHIRLKKFPTQGQKEKS